MNSYILEIKDIDQTNLGLVGGKGANLALLGGINGISVPEGFCVTTEAYKHHISQLPGFQALLEQLSVLKPDDVRLVGDMSKKIRDIIEEAPITKAIEDVVTFRLEKLGESACAVRSSATAEDLPTASFAGQQDSYLNIIGTEAILKHIRRCWASLFTERAIIYRIKNGFDHRRVYLAVVVQKMIFPHAAGIMFTADPVTSDRKVLSIDASFGLGEALVSGLVNADSYKVRDGKIVEKKISAKKIAVYAIADGGTKEEQINSEQQKRQTLTDEEILLLERIGRRVESHFGQPQDIEWCLAGDQFYIVQSRPITTLFPIPQANDQQNHVYVSVGHQQMMTDAMKPLGLSLWQLTAARPMFTAGGRLFVDVTHQLALPSARKMLLASMGQHNPLVKDALETVLERENFVTQLPDDTKEPDRNAPLPDFQTLKDFDPRIVSDLIKRSETSIKKLTSSLQSKSGQEVLDFILEDIQQLKKSLFDPQNMEVIITAMNASAWINEKMEEWLGEKNVADTLSQSVSNNITSEMGLALMDVADVIRPYPEVINYLQNIKDDNFLTALTKVEGGEEARGAIYDYLNKYGMRCAGEIDITKTRWSENPAVLIPVILNNIKHFESGASKRKFEQGLAEAVKKEKEILERLKQLPDGEQKSNETKRMIDLVRNLIGYREYPKYSMVNRYFVYKQALLKEAERLVQTGVIKEREDIFYCSFEELLEVFRTNSIDYQIVDNRKSEFKFYEKLTPPHVITSDGEIITGSYKRQDLHPGAIAGLAVSAGVVEGRARVILNMEDADLQAGDILVTVFTDPSWTPLFVSIKGLVTEVGGLMTHGAVIAREYGLPAVVGVENATKLIKDGQRIRVHGTEGYIEILPASQA